MASLVVDLCQRRVPERTIVSGRPGRSSPAATPPPPLHKHSPPRRCSLPSARREAFVEAGSSGKRQRYMLGTDGSSRSWLISSLATMEGPSWLFHQARKGWERDEMDEALGEAVRACGGTWTHSTMTNGRVSRSTLRSGVRPLRWSCQVPRPRYLASGATWPRRGVFARRPHQSDRRAS